MSPHGPGHASGTVYERPGDLARLLDGAVEAASRTRFYAGRLRGRPRIASVEDMASVPVTPLGLLRAQSLADVVTDASAVQWIAGRLGGQDPERVAVTEGYDETGRRYDIFRDALREAAPAGSVETAAVLTDPERRYFAAEVGSILGYMGIRAHVFMADGTGRAYERLGQVRPDVLVLVSDTVEEAALPASLTLAVTFRRSYPFVTLPQLDVYTVDELGFLAHSTDLRRWVVYNDQYFFEVSESGRLIVTSLRGHVQPLLRVDTGDGVTRLGTYDMALGDLRT